MNIRKFGETMTFKEHNQFRTTKEWKDFRKKILEKRGLFCECCGTSYTLKTSRRLQVHHKDPKNYLDLSPEKFCLLCSECHKLIERVSKKINGKKGIKNKEKWLELLKDYLPYS